MPQRTEGRVGLWPLSFEAATEIALNMRRADAAEIFACRFDTDDAAGRAALALEVTAAVAARGLGWIAGDARPIAAFGAVERWPGVWAAFQFATPAWPCVVRAVTRFARSEARAALLARGARRCEVRSAAWRHDAHRWLTALGAVAEARHPAHGRDGHAYLTFAWTVGEQKETRTDVHLQRAQPAVLAAAAAGPAGAR